MVDTIFGGAGNDTIEGGAGADSLDGGAGSRDLVSYRNSQAGVNVDISGSFSFSNTGGDAQGDRLTGFEDLEGSSFDDVLEGNGLQNSINGLGGDDIIQLLNGDDTSGEHYDGGADTDTLELNQVSTAASFSLADDTVEGFEILRLQNIGLGLIEDIEVVLSGEQAAQFTTFSARAHLGATYEIIVSAAQSGFADLSGATVTGFNQPGDRFIIDGLSNPDGLAITGSSITGEVSAGFGNDTISGLGGNDTLNGSDGDDVIYGGQGNDLIYGGDTADTLLGDAGNDTLNGDAGNDAFVWTQGGGSDAIYGGNNTDLFDGSADATDQVIDLETGAATIGGDVLTLDSIEDVTTGAGNDLITEQSNSSFVNVLRAGLGDDEIVKLSSTRPGLQDTYDGGGDIDTFTYRLAGDPFFLGIEANLVTGKLTFNGADRDIILGFENVTFDGIGGSIVGDGKDNVLRGVGDRIHTLTGGAGDDTLIGGLDDNVLYGGDGFDVGVSDALHASSTVTSLGGGVFEVSGPEGLDRVEGVEKLVFTDADVFLEGPSEAGALPLTQASVQSFAGEQDQGVGTVSAGAAAVTIEGNVWKRVEVNKTVTADTWLSFDLDAADAGEILGIGLDEDAAFLGGQIFQLGGAQTFGNQGFRSYTAGDGTVHYAIPVGQFFTGLAQNLTLVGDDDADGSTDATFSNITFTEGAPLLIGGVAVAARGGYAGQGGGSVVLETEGREMRLGDNGWQRFEVDVEVDAETVIAFDIRALDLGEFVGVGVDNDLDLTLDQFVRLAGSQVPIPVAGTEPYQLSSSFQKFEVPIGAFVAAGTYQNLIFAVDDDAYASGAVRFRDIEILQTPSSVTVSSDADGQDAGRVQEFAEGGTLKLSQNAWKDIDLGALDIDANTVLHFQFRADTEGEIHGIGLDTDDGLSGDRIYQQLGTQTFGLQAHNGQYTPDEGFESYTIEVGQDFTGTFDRLTLVTDDDTPNPRSDSYFRDIFLTGVGAGDETVLVL